MTPKRPLRLWRWDYPQGVRYFRLNADAVMERLSERGWIAVDGYWLKRASEDPEFVEITPDTAVETPISDQNPQKPRN